MVNNMKKILFCLLCLSLFLTNFYGFNKTKWLKLIYSFKQYCECEIIMLTENVIFFFVWNWGVKRTKVWICVKTYLLTTTPSPININLSNYEKEFNMFWDHYLKLYVWGNGTVGILHSMFWGSIGTLWWKPTVHTFKTNIGE